MTVLGLAAMIGYSPPRSLEFAKEYGNLREKSGEYHIGLEKQIKNFRNLSRFGFWRRGANGPLSQFALW